MTPAKWIGAVFAIFVSLRAAHAQDPTFMVDKMNGWKMAYMSGVEAVLRTADGGKHWMDVSPPVLADAAKGQDAVDLEESTAICPLDAQRAWMAVTLKDRVMLEFTSSGGRHWTEIMGPPAMVAVNISFLDEQTGFVLDSSDTAAGHQLKEIYATYDGGQRWKNLTSPNLEGMGYYTTGITFRSPLEGWVTGTYHGAPAAPLFRTEDGGKTWNVQKLTFPRDYQGGYADIYRPVFIGAGKMHGYLPVNLVRHDPPPDRRAWVNYETDDGGLTWHAPGSGPMAHVTQDYTYDVPVVLEGYVTKEPAVENLGEPWPEGEKPRKASTIFVLVLKKPITVIGNPADPISTETETNVSHLQMIDSGPGDVAAWEARLENHVKQRDLIVVHGSLLHAHTVHHKMPVLLLPTSFRPANAPDSHP
jgi:photosystem II stability/assembly factor-like uncharacterized protein